MDKKLIGQRLKELRGYTPLRVVAEACHISIGTLASYEAGSRMPRDEIKLVLAKYYKKSVQSIFFAK